jgi:glycosyltransferase involved in cell wall biosynthesis
MKIAMLHPTLTLQGGAERQLLVLARELQQAGHDIEIFTYAISDDCFSELTKKLTINLIQPPFIQNTPLTKRTYSTRLAGRFRGYTVDLPSMVYMGRKIPQGFDLINSHNSPTQWAAFFAKKRLKAPIVWTCNEPPVWYFEPKQKKGLGNINRPLYTGLDKIVINYIDKIVANSLADSCRIQNAYGKPSEIVYPGITADLLYKASGNRIRIKYGLENSFILLQVANMARDKHQSDSITALYYLSKKHDNVKLILVGRGLKNDLIALARHLGVEQKVLFLQDFSDEELAEIYAVCNVFLFPAEITWGLTVIEAMAAAKPVVVSVKAGISEIIQNGVNGFLFEEPNAKKMVEIVEQLMADSDLCLKIGSNAREYTKGKLSWKMYAKHMENIFKKTIDINKKNSTRTQTHLHPQ